MEYIKKDLGEQIAEGLCSSAEGYRRKNNFVMAEKLYLEALKWREELLLRDKEYYLPLIAKTLDALALVAKESNTYALSVKYYKKSIAVRKLLSGKQRIKLAMSYADLADLCRREDDYEEAKEFYSEALTIFIGLAPEDFNAVQMKVLNIYNHLGVICNADNQYEETKDAYMGALTLYKGLVHDESDEYREELALKLFELGTLYFKHQRLNRSKEVYLFSLELLLYLDDLEPNRYTDICAMIFHRLGTIYTSQLEYADALASYRTSLKYYVGMAEENPLQYGPYVARVFADLAALHKKQNKMEEAQYFHLKAVDIYLNLMHYNESAYALILASTIIDGVIEYGQHTLSLYQAELILEEYYEEKNGDVLLEKIHSIREETGVLS